MSEKRNDYITWDEYFMGVAKLQPCALKIRARRWGACIVSGDNKILSMGYNGFRRDARRRISVGKKAGDRGPYNAKYFYTTQ